MKELHIHILKYIGEICGDFRRDIGKLQKDVAYDLNMSQKEISKFETGQSNNAVVLLWYVLHGLSAARIGEELAIKEAQYDKD